jgi:hypothetical protein
MCSTLHPLIKLKLINLLVWSTIKGKGGQGEALTSVTLPWAFCIEIRYTLPPETLRFCQDTYSNCFTFQPLLMAIRLLECTATCLVASERVYSG